MHGLANFRGLVRLSGFCLAWLAHAVTASEPPQLVRDAFDEACPVAVIQQGSVIEVRWQIGRGRTAELAVELDEAQPLFKSLSVSAGPDQPFRHVAGGLDPVLQVRVGDRDLEKRGGWTIFFDRMQEKPSQSYAAAFGRSRVRLQGNRRRATLVFESVTAGPFQGDFRVTFFDGDSFVLQEAVLATDRARTAYLYDMGLVFRGQLPSGVVWRDSDAFRREVPAELHAARTVRVQGRSAAVETANGALAVFPSPHRYFYPLDFSDNLSNIWIGPSYVDDALPFGIGIRHDPRGDNRFVPWFNAPVGSRQEMGMFLSVSEQDAGAALKEIAALTRQDHFAPLPGHQVFASHFHVEHTRELERAQAEEGGELTGQLPSGGSYRIPARLRDPGFVRTLRNHGVDIVHLAEFHFGRTPRWNAEERLRNLELLHAECERLSNDRFLLLPGEEPNVHLGGHWISFFPNPVYWVLNRPEGTPFVSDHPSLGKIYHVGSEAEVYRLLNREGGLAWTAHPRIKSSTGYPDRYRDRPFFQSDRFLGGAWKAMPADLSQPLLGKRVLDLLDDMSNWGPPKYVLGEVDVFKIEPEHELYAHMSVNYVRLDEPPRFQDGWQPLLDALRAGAFFVTTGEILVSNFTVNGRHSGETCAGAETVATIKLALDWTFPLDRVEIVSGDGMGVDRQAIDMSQTGSLGSNEWTFPFDRAGKRWVRIEAWDIARNGAFTQPVWFTGQ